MVGGTKTPGRSEAASGKRWRPLKRKNRPVNPDEDLVVVRRQWNDSLATSYRLKDIDGVRWDTVSGGFREPAPQPFLHAYVNCRGMTDGGVSHSRIHGSCPHQIKVCIVKKDNDPAVFEYLKNMAGTKPISTNKININRHSSSQLKARLTKHLELNATLATAIVEGRPYARKTELVQKQILPKETYARISGPGHRRAIACQRHAPRDRFEGIVLKQNERV